MGRVIKCSWRSTDLEGLERTLGGPAHPNINADLREDTHKYIDKGKVVEEKFYNLVVNSPNIEAIFDEEGGVDAKYAIKLKDFQEADLDLTSFIHKAGYTHDHNRKHLRAVLVLGGLSTAIAAGLGAYAYFSGI